MNDAEFENLSEKSKDYLRACDERVSRYFGIGGYERYEYDLFNNEIWWSDDAIPKVRGKVTIVGTFSTKSDTWLWSWANPHFNEIEIGPINEVRDFGEREGIPRLTEKKWPCEEVDAWEMTAISARLLEAQGAYLSPSVSGGLFLLYDQLEFIPEEDLTRYLPLKRKASDDEAE